MRCLLSAVIPFAAVSLAFAEEKAETIRSGKEAPARELFQRPAGNGAKGHQMTVFNDKASVPVVVVRGTPYEMGRQLGDIIGPQMKQFVPAAMEGISKKIGVSLEAMHDVWSRSAAFTDDRVEQELAGLADGSGVPLSLLQSMHAVPLLMPYSCSSIAAWGAATADGHLYQT